MNHKLRTKVLSTKLKTFLLFSRIRKSLGFRSQQFIYTRNVLTRRYILESKLQSLVIQEKACCRTSALMAETQAKSKTRFSQFYFASTSDLVVAEEFEKGLSSQSCEICKKRYFSSSNPFVYISLNSLRSIDWNFLSQILRHSPTILIGFTEKKNLQLEEIVPLVEHGAKRIFVENLQVGNTLSILPLPLGLRDGWQIRPSNYPMSENFYPILKEAKNIAKTQSRTFAKFSLWTNPVREIIMQEIKESPDKFNFEVDSADREFRIPTGNIHPREYLMEFSSYQFALCPEGAAVDTHRFYEAVASGVVPIVCQTNSTFDLISSVFPCIVLKSWIGIKDFQIREEMYLSKLHEMRKLEEKFPRLDIRSKDLPRLFAVKDDTRV